MICRLGNTYCGTRQLPVVVTMAEDSDTGSLDDKLIAMFGPHLCVHFVSTTKLLPLPLGPP